MRFAHFPEKSAMQHTPKEQPLTPGKPHRRAHVVSHARPSVLALQPVFRSAPRRGAHTAKPNSVRLRATSRAARGPGATPQARGTHRHPIPPPFPVRERGRGVTESARRGIACGRAALRRRLRPAGRGTPRIGLLFRSWSPMIPTGHRCVKGRKKIPMGFFCFYPLTHRHPAGASATPNGKTNTERK